MNGTNSSATQKLCLISHLARFWADNGQPGSNAQDGLSTLLAGSRLGEISPGADIQI